MNDTATIQTSAEHGAATRMALIDTARDIFARNGFDGASVRMITSAADVNLGAVTYHFGSKRGLYDAVLEAGLRPLLHRVRLAAAHRGAPLDRIRAVVEAYFGHLAEHPDLPHLLLQEVAAGREPPPAVLEIIGEVKTTIAGLHQQGVAEGSIRDGDPTLMALSVASQPLYLTVIAPMLRAVAGIDLGDRVDRQMVIDHVSEFVRRGLEPRPEEAK